VSIHVNIWANRTKTPFEMCLGLRLLVFGVGPIGRADVPVLGPLVRRAAGVVARARELPVAPVERLVDGPVDGVVPVVPLPAAA
jgi:hypothetical protein